jgi:hypothetical protein
MNGGLALHVALALHGNAWLAEGDGPAPALEETNSTFQYVLSFAADEATSTAAWFERLRADGVGALQLGCTLPRSADDVGRAAFAESHPWALVTVGAVDQVWSGTMAYVEGADRQRPWDVSMQLFEGGPPVARPSVEDAARELDQALAQATEIARREGWDRWATWFERAQARLVAGEPAPRFHPDLAPDGALDLPHRRLLASAVGGWVFGGMGSWNDAVLPDPERQDAFEAATLRLYTALVTALMAVVNA